MTMKQEFAINLHVLHIIQFHHDEESGVHTACNSHTRNMLANDIRRLAPVTSPHKASRDRIVIAVSNVWSVSEIIYYYCYTWQRMSPRVLLEFLNFFFLLVHNSP